MNRELYAKFPDNKSVSVYRLVVTRVTLFSSREIYDRVMCCSENEAYIRVRAKALYWDFRTESDFGINYGVKDLGSD